MANRSTSPVPNFVNTPYLEPNRSPFRGQQSFPPIESNNYVLDEFEQREEQYNYQIQKMSDHINQLEHEIQVLIHSNEGIQQDYARSCQDLQLYKDQLQKLFQLYQQQTSQYDTIKKKVQQSNQSVDKAYEKTIDQNNDVQNLLLDRDLLLSKLETGDKQYNFDVSSLTAQLNDKNSEIADQRKRLNELLELKRKAEEEIQSLRFTLDHQTAKLESELREKTLKLEQMDRQFTEALYLKDNELVDAFDKIRVLEHEVRRVLDLNRNYAQELSMLARDNRFKQEEINKQSEKPIPQITIQSGGMEPKLPPQWKEKLHNKIDAVLDIYEKTHTREVQQLCLNLWKTKMELQNRLKQNKSLAGEGMQLAKVVATSGGVDFRIATHLIDSFIAAITFNRDSVSNVVFELFVKSVNKANNKKQNSFVLFYQNLKEVQQKQYKGLWLALEVYAKLRKSLRHSVPLLIDSKVHSGLLEKVELAMGKLMKHDMDFRNNVNKWLEGTMAFTIQKKDQEAYDKNRDYLFLFRMLTIKYRIKFPLQGKTFEVDVDLETFLEHKICYSLRKIIKLQTSEPSNKK